MGTIKLRKLYFLLVFMVLIVGMACTSCKKSATGVKIDTTIEKGTTFFVGDSLKFQATVSPEDARNTAVKWSSSNSAVAIISQDGYMLTVGVGTSTIICTTEKGKHADSVKIIVVENYAANIKGIYKGTLTIDDTETMNDISITISPISSTLSEKISISLNRADMSIRSHATLSFNGHYDIQGDGFFNTSRSLMLEGNVNSEVTTAYLVFTVNSHPSKIIVFNGIKN